MRLDQLIPDFLHDTRDRIRTDSSRDTYRRLLNQLADDLGDTQLDKIVEEDLKSFCLNARDGGQLAPRTIASRRTKVTRFFTWAHRAGHLDENPAAFLPEDIRPRVRSVRRHNWLTSEQCHAVLDACPDSPIGRRDRVVLALGLYAGLRPYEITHLRWRSVGSDCIMLDVTKGEKAAMVGLPPSLKKIIDAWRSDVPAKPAQFVCCSMRHSLGTDDTTVVPAAPLGRDGVRLVLKRSHERTGIYARPHDLRRSFAGLLEAQGQPIEVISKALRHDQLSTTQTYLEDNPRKAVDALATFEL